MNLWFRTCKVALVLALSMALSGHWALLQTTAWVRMLVVYAQQDSLLTALTKTFDARHPCALCLQIRQAQQEERQKGSPLPQEKPETMPELFYDAHGITVPVAPIAAVELPALLLDGYSSVLESPPTPPPRVEVAVL